jgi:acetyl esterase/lipase
MLCRRLSPSWLAGSVLLFGLLWVGNPVTLRAADKKADPQAPAGVVHVPDVTYSEKTGLKLDLACPKNLSVPAPAILVIHGGFWQEIGGNRKTCLPIAFELAEHGYVAVAVSHRKASDAPFPAQLHDVKCAVRWLRANAEKYHIDPERIGVLGYSSGGHLASLLGTTADNAALEGDCGDAGQSSRVEVVVACYSPSDLLALYDSCDKGRLSIVEKAAGKSVLETLICGKPADLADRYAEASPVHHAGKHSAPTLLIHGTADRQVPLDQSQRLASKLRRAGVEVHLLSLEKAGHSFGGVGDDAPSREADRATLEFFERSLKPSLVRR